MAWITSDLAKTSRGGCFGDFHWDSITGSHSMQHVFFSNCLFVTKNEGIQKKRKLPWSCSSSGLVFQSWFSGFSKVIITVVPPLTLLLSVQVNLYQKLLFLRQLTHNMTKIVNWITISIHENSKLKPGQKLFLTFRTIFVHNMVSPCSAKRRVSDKDLPVCSQFTRGSQLDNTGT